MSEGEQTTSHVPRQDTEGVGSEANRTQLLGNTNAATGSLTTETSTDTNRAGDSGGDSGAGGDGGGSENGALGGEGKSGVRDGDGGVGDGDVRGDREGIGTEGGSKKEADLTHVKISLEANPSVSHKDPTTDKGPVQGSFPPSLSGVPVPIGTHGNTDVKIHQVVYPHLHLAGGVVPSKFGPRYDGHNPPSGPRYDGHYPPSGPRYDGHYPPSGPGWDGHHPQFGPRYDGHHQQSGPRYDGHHQQSGPRYDGYHPPSVPGSHCHHPQSGPMNEGRPPPSGTRCEGHHPPGYDERNPLSGLIYERYHPQSGLYNDCQHPRSGPGYDKFHPPSGPLYYLHQPPSGPEYGGHHVLSGSVVTHTEQQRQMCHFPTHSAHKPYYSSAPSNSVTSHVPPPSQTFTPHQGSVLSRRSSSYGTQSPEGPLLSKPLPHQTGCPKTSSKPSSDNEVEEVCIEDSFRVLVENASSSTQADCIQNFLEAKTELAVDAVLPGGRPGTFLVTFKEKPDIGQLKSCFMKRRIEDSWLKVSHVLQSACVKVTSLTPDITDDGIKFYFMNKRKSDGGDVKTVTRSPDSTGAIVHFYDPEVARRVCARTHKLHAKDVVVTYHHELLETWVGKDESSHGTSQANTGTQQGPRPSRSSGTSGRGNLRSETEEPAATIRSTTRVAGKAQQGRAAEFPGASQSVIIKTLDACLLHFLWKSTPCQKEFVKYMKETLHGRVRFILQSKNTVMLIVEHSGPVHELRAWKASIQKEVSEYVCTYLKVECLRTSVPDCLLDDILRAVNPILSSNPNLVRLYHGMKNTDLIICGFRGKVDDVTFQISKVKQSAKPVSPPRIESCHLKQFQARYLAFSNFEDKFPKVTTRIDTETDIITFEGPNADVITAKLECLRVAQNLVLEGVTFKSEEAMKVLGSRNTTDFIQPKLSHAHCVWGLGEKEVRVYAGTEADAKNGRKVVETSLIETAVAIDTSASTLLSTAEWREKRGELLEAHPGKLALVHQKEALLIVSTSDIGDLVKEEVEQFFRRNVLRSKSLSLEPSTAKFLNMFKSNEIRSVEGKLEKHRVKVIVEEGSVCCELRISGYQQGFVEAEKRLNQMISEIFSKRHKICLPGIEEFFVKGKGRELLSAVEQNEKCIIEVKDKSPDKKEKKMREMKRWDVPSGGVLSVILGDMRDLGVDAIVNAANKDLQHGGGVAKAIVDKGGNAIVKFCDRYIQENGQLVDGEAVCSPAGSLPCKVVIHAVGPVWAGGDEGEQEVLKETVGNILKVAESNKIKSIALPAISTGIFGYPVQEAVTAIMEALLNMWQPDPVDYDGPQHVYLCDIKSDTVDMFVKIGNNLFEKDGGHHPDSDVDSSEESVVGEEPVQYSNSGSDSEDASDADSTKESTSIASDEDGANFSGIRVVSRELASVKADVLVNPAHCDLDLTSGAVSMSLLQAAGPQLQEECNRKYEEGINFGEVAVTKGGNLQCKVVFHGLLLKWNNGKGKAEKVLRTLVTECLTEADSRGYTSIAFPALGTGRQGFPADIAADLMFSSVRTFLDTNAASPLQSVYFVVHPSDRAVFKAFKAELQRPYGDTDWMTSPARPHPGGTTSRGRAGSSRRHRTFGRGHVPDAPRQESAAPAGVSGFGKLLSMMTGLNWGSPTGSTYKLGTVTVVITQGDVTMETTDCIVNCCKESCDLNYSAVSKAILRAAGPDIQRECFEKKHSMAKYGYILTSGGNLRCKMVAHVRAQHSSYGWTKVLSQCMDWVNKKGVSTMSLPALGTGGLKQSPVKMASAIYDAINKYGSSHPTPSLSQVRVVIFQEEMVNSFMTVFAGGRPPHSTQRKRGDQGRRRKMTHRRSKPSRHESPDVGIIDTSNKHIDDSVILCIFTDENKHAEAAKKRITNLCKEEFDHKPLSKSWNEFIGSLKAKEVSTLYRVADDNGVALSKTAGGLTLTGPVRLVSATHDIIVEKLQTLQKKFLMQREARTLAQLVQWVYVDEKGRSTPFSPGLNCQLEKARNDKVKTLEIEDYKGRQYKVDLEAKVEYPAGGGKPLTIHRMEKGAPSGLGRYVDGEKEALAGSTTVYFPIMPERNFKGTAEDLHFRTAESQFYRLLSDQGGRYKVVKVEYVVTPDLVRRFSSAQESLKKSRGEMNAQPILAFHGTDEGNITKICEKGFLKHGDAGFQMKSGNKYGNGVYFSEYPDYSMRYIRGATKLLLCKVLLGKTYTISSFTQGSVHPGYDSHTSACGKELVIFDTSRILPSYIVHYK
ncbi:protein mono-ADP-ribosyltransferase PARP14-like [Haliotis asinina]|uniref:protein mono-ADP-ribosyltransferase PARP14-like n=1 Tax=Haliotis asinina TaxID=109174 RepID=UPI003532242B